MLAIGSKAPEINARTPEQLRSFTVGNYRYDEERSTETEYVFIRAASEDEG